MEYWQLLKGVQKNTGKFYKLIVWKTDNVSTSIWNKHVQITIWSPSTFLVIWWLLLQKFGQKKPVLNSQIIFLFSDIKLGDKNYSIIVWDSRKFLIPIFPSVPFAKQKSPVCSLLTSVGQLLYLPSHWF